MADIIFDPTGSIESFSNKINILSAKNESVMILACDANGFKKELIDPILLKHTISMIGGIFPSVIYNNKKYDQGTVFIGLNEKIQINIIKDVSQKNYDNLDADMEEQRGGFDESVKTMFVFMDGLTRHIGKCVRVLFDNYGLDINYIGGGSGSLSFEQKPSILTNHGLLQDAFVYAYSKRRSSIGVNHGWKSISGPYQVTKSEATIIKELDYMPAFDVYKNIVDQYSSTAIDKNNFFNIAKSFPFGINTLSNENIVRNPIILTGSQLVCVGNVEEGNYVNILQGSRDSLLKAAKSAADISQKNMNFENDFTLFIDCISRVLFLGEDFCDEIKAVYKENTSLVGALTFGEIANDGSAYLEFFNKTSVVGNIGHG